MTQFTARVLPVLDRIYRFVGGDPGIAQLDNQLPIQRVHDLSREAELMSAVPEFGGYFLGGTDSTHVGADTQEATDDPYATLDLFPGGREGRWIWLMHVGLTANTGMTLWSIAVGLVPFGQTIARRDFPLIQYAGSHTFNDQGVAPATLATGPNAATGGGSWLTEPLPFPLTPGSTVRYRGTSSGAGISRFSCLYWAGAIGALPPGL